VRGSGIAGQAHGCTHQRAVLVGAAFHLQAAIAIAGQPGPAAAEAGLRGLAEGVLEGIEAAEITVDGRGQLIIGCTTVGAEHGPEQAVVGVAAAVVADRAALRLGHGIEVGDQRLDRLLGDAGLLDGGIEVVDVGLVVLAVMDSIVRASKCGSRAS
jgi:hypothetical protein